MFALSAPSRRMSYFVPVGVLTRLVTSDKYGGSARDAVNGLMSGVTTASGLDPTSKTLRHRVR